MVDLSVFDQSLMARLRQAPAHPDIYDCGPSLPLENGYPMLFAPAEVRARVFPNYLDDPRQGTRGLPPDSVDRSARECRGFEMLAVGLRFFS